MALLVWYILNNSAFIIVDLALDINGGSDGSPPSGSPIMYCQNVKSSPLSEEASDILHFRDSITSPIAVSWI